MQFLGTILFWEQFSGFHFVPVKILYVGLIM